MSRPNSASSQRSTRSVSSVLSDDSYVANLEKVDIGLQDMIAQFKEIAEKYIVAETGNPILMERKIQSHEVKKRDPADTTKEIWTREAKADYSSYKASENVTKKLKDAAARSRHAALGANISSFYLLALNPLIPSMTADARFSFMAKYPKIFNTAKTKTQIDKAAEFISSAKNAKQEISRCESELNKIFDLEAIEATRREAQGGAN
ncbi:hypothetical protein F5B20DRAFT_579909 [Whalleya microplaca]|nr:hypothetical protein F5B20DRAFT_579909 [Whalleya microplaca]